MTTQNSIDSYLELIDSGRLGDKQRAVFDFIQSNPDCTYNDICRGMKQAHNAITARINELREKGLVICSGSKVDEFTNKTNNCYRIRLADQPADDMNKDARPIIPREVLNFLKEKTKIGATDEVLTLVRKGVRYTASCAGGEVNLDYGGVIKLCDIQLVCEETAQNKAIITGMNFKMIFRLN